MHAVEGGELIAENTSDFFIRGGRGSAGEAAPAATWSEPTGDPDAVVEFATRPNQALLYRLTGDRNPLHSDPEFARRSGFGRPILHGMCTFGFTGRALMRALLRPGWSEIAECAFHQPGVSG